MVWVSTHSPVAGLARVRHNQHLLGRPRSGQPFALAWCNSKEAAMSRAGVGWVIDRLIGDRNLRLRFAFDPVQTVVELYLRGVDLSVDEIDLLCRTDVRVWVPGDSVRVGARH